MEIFSANHIYFKNQYSSESFAKSSSKNPLCPMSEHGATGGGQGVGNLGGHGGGQMGNEGVSGSEQGGHLTEF